MTGTLACAHRLPPDYCPIPARRHKRMLRVPVRSVDVAAVPSHDLLRCAGRKVPHLRSQPRLFPHASRTHSVDIILCGGIPLRHLHVRGRCSAVKLGCAHQGLAHRCANL